MVGAPRFDVQDGEDILVDVDNSVASLNPGERKVTKKIPAIWEITCVQDLPFSYNASHSQAPRCAVAWNRLSGSQKCFALPGNYKFSEFSILQIPYLLGENNNIFILPHLTDSSEDYCARLWLIVCKRFSHLVVEFRLWRRKCKPGGEWVEYFNNFLFSILFAPLRCGNPLQYLLCSPFAVANRLWTQRPLHRSLEQQIRSKKLLRRRSCRHGR